MVESWAGQKVLVMGLGLNQGGLSVAQWLLRQGAQITITDLKTAKQLRSSLRVLNKLTGAKKIRYVLGRHDAKDFRTHDVIIKNPGVANNSPYLALAKKYKIPVINEALLFFGVFAGPKIGVTGTRGKSTTATLIHHILKTEIKNNVLAGNIATTGMMSVVDKLDKKSWPVLELSSWHLESLDEYGVSPELSVVTNVLLDHLNRYPNFAAYKKAKLAIVKYQRQHDRTVLNFDNQHSRSFAKKTKAQVYYFSTKKKVRGSYLSGENIYFNNGRTMTKVMSIAKIKLRGEHNLSNILAAVTVAKLLGLSHSHINKAVNSFAGLKYRLEHLGHIKNMDVYNDATSTTPDAVAAALATLADRPTILIAGGEDKKLDFQALAKQIKKRIHFLVLLKGSASNKLERALRKINFPVSKIKSEVPNLTQAWKLALAASPVQKSYLLFSPGATSFNMFINEFDRARQLEKLFYDSQKKK